MDTIQDIIDFQLSAQASIKASVALIESAKENIDHYLGEIDKSNDRLLSIFGLESGEMVKYIHHEHFGECGSYSAYFEQELEIIGMHIQEDKIAVTLRKKGRKMSHPVGIYNSFSIYKLDGTLIVDNKLKHVREPHPVSDEMKERCVKAQMI